MRDGVGGADSWQIAHSAPVEVRSMPWNGDQVSSLTIGAGYTVEVFGIRPSGGRGCATPGRRRLI